MTRDEWITDNAPVINRFVTAWGKSKSAQNADIDDIRAEAFLRLTSRAEKIRQSGKPFPTKKSYASAIARHTIIDYLRGLDRRREITEPEKGHWSIDFPPSRGVGKRRGFSNDLGGCQSERPFSFVCRDFNGPANDYNSVESDLPYSVDMTAAELAALDSYMNPESQDQEPWERDRAKRRVLSIMKRLGIDAQNMRQYTSRRANSGSN